MRVYGQWDPWASAEEVAEVREHLLALSRVGVGRRAVAKVLSMSATVLGEIRSGRHTKIRRETAEKILALTASDARRPHALVDAAESWRLIDELIAAGVRKYEIARWLGQHGAGLQLRRTRVLARHATQIQEIHDALWRAEPRVRLHCRCHERQRAIA
ncbi:MAG: hypothetical protein M3P18_06975 [Actinomycetota bacterium]|nr:hypothetical protein [Actinomycetota bacterium]